MTFDAYLDDLIDYAEKLTRDSLAQLPDGEVEFEEWNDDGVGHGPIRIHLKLKKQGSEILADFSATDDDLGGAVHCNRAFTVSCTYAAIRTVLAEAIPNNAGLYRAITVITRPGTFVDVSFPAAVGSRGQVGFRLRSIVLGALAKLIPDRLPACAGGSEFAIAASGNDRQGQRFLPDTGGIGSYRGALGMVRQYRFLVDNVNVQIRSDRFTSRPWGLAGGGARNVLNPGQDSEQDLPSKFIRLFNQGEVLRAEMAAAGNQHQQAG